MKPALLKTLAIVLVTALVFLLGWHMLHGGWVKVRESVTGNYHRRPLPASGPLALGPDGYYWGVAEDWIEQPGYLYKMKTDGSDWKIVHTFVPNVAPHAGTFPQSGLVSDGVDSLLGITSADAQQTGYGTLFKINAATGVLTTLVEFTGKAGPNQGSKPRAALVPGDMGFFWGSTKGGGTNDTGTIFKFHPATGVLTTVAEMPPSPSSEALASGIVSGLASDGKGYWWGTNSIGGKERCGTVFKVNASTGEMTTVVEFTKGNGGKNPRGGLVSDGQGFLWGTCTHGGTLFGTLFKVSTTTDALSSVVDFSGARGSNLGENPQAALVSDGQGFLWGSTMQGGSGSYGTIFKVDISSGALTTLLEFDRKESRHKGYSPQSTLVSDGHGAFLGTTSGGGKKNAGTIFKIDIATGVLTTLVELGKVGP